MHTSRAGQLDSQRPKGRGCLASSCRNQASISGPGLPRACAAATQETATKSRGFRAGETGGGRDACRATFDASDEELRCRLLLQLRSAPIEVWLTLFSVMLFRAGNQQSRAHTQESIPSSCSKVTRVIRGLLISTAACILHLPVVTTGLHQPQAEPQAAIHDPKHAASTIVFC